MNIGTAAHPQNINASIEMVLNQVFITTVKFAGKHEMTVTPDCVQMKI